MQTQANSSTAVLDNTGEPTAPGTREILRGENLRKTFRSGAQDVTPLAGINLTIARGEMVAVVGPSGTGKSTLLHLLAALDTPTSGTVYFAGKSLQSFSEAELAEYRNRAVGFVWQRHHLLPDFTAAENVAMPLLVRGVTLAQALRTADRMARRSRIGRSSRAAWGSAIWGRTATCGHRASTGEWSGLTAGRRAYRRPGSTQRRKYFRIDAAAAPVAPVDIHPCHTQHFISPARRPCSDLGTRSSGPGRRSAERFRGTSPAGRRCWGDDSRRPWVTRV